MFINQFFKLRNFFQFIFKQNLNSLSFFYFSELAIIGLIIKLLLIIIVVNGEDGIKMIEKKDKNYATKHSIFHLLEKSAGWHRTVYYYRHTIAIRDTLKHTNIKHCEVFQLE